MTLRLNGATSGFTEIDAPAVAGSNTLILPGGNGSADQALVTNGSGTLSFADRGRMVLETAKPSTSGTSVDFTSIPSWVKRVTVMMNGVSTSGTSGIRFQLGTSSGPEATGYSGGNVRTASSSLTGGTFSLGFDIGAFGVSTETQNGQFIISLFQSSTNTWACSGSTGGGAITNTIAGIKALSSVLTQVRITTVNGTDTFDAGTINLLLEG